MIYYLECDTAGNIDHAACSANATIVPPVNQVAWLDPKTQQPIVNTAGVVLSSYGLPFVDPIGITVDDYTMIAAGGTSNFIYNSTTNTVEKRPVTNAPAAS
jgi:hypothetical protein